MQYYNTFGLDLHTYIDSKTSKTKSSSFSSTSFCHFLSNDLQPWKFLFAICLDWCNINQKRLSYLKIIQENLTLDISWHRIISLSNRLYGIYSLLIFSKIIFNDPGPTISEIPIDKFSSNKNMWLRELQYHHQYQYLQYQP